MSCRGDGRACSPPVKTKTQKRQPQLLRPKSGPWKLSFGSEGFARPVEIGEEEKEIRFLEAEQSPLAVASLDMKRCFVHPFTRFKQATPTFIPGAAALSMDHVTAVTWCLRNADCGQLLNVTEKAGAHRDTTRP